MTQDKPNYHHGDVPKALMDAALLRIKNDGVEKLSLRALARDIGVSPSAPYRHFKDKQQLLICLACDGFRALADYKSNSDGEAGTLENLIEVGTCYVHFAQNNPEQYKLMFGSKIEARAEQTDLQVASQEAFRVIVNETEAGVAAGILIDIAPEFLAKSCWTMVHGLSLLAIDGFFDKQEMAFDDFLRQQLVLGIRGLARNPDALTTA